MSHLLDEPLPVGMFTPAEEALIRYSRASARLEPITDDLYAALAEHFNVKQIMEVSVTVGASQLITRFTATFRTDVDGATVEATRDVVASTRHGVVWASAGPGAGSAGQPEPPEEA